MDRSQLTLILAIGLFVAVGLGWLLRWIYDLLNPPPPPEPVADSEWAEYAKACEAARDEANARLHEVERDLGNKLVQTHAEYEAAMDGLGEARREAEALRRELDDLRASSGAGDDTPIPFITHRSTDEPSEPDAADPPPAGRAPTTG